MHGRFGFLDQIIPVEEDDMASTYTAVIQQDDGWWIGWIEEVPGVNAQERTREELLDSLRSTLQEALEMNRADALAGLDSTYEEVSIQV
jgi:predicted RNase H-like HicB family nuclease